MSLFSRRHKLFNHQYPHIVDALAELPDGTVVDGEEQTSDQPPKDLVKLLLSFRGAAEVEALRSGIHTEK